MDYKNKVNGLIKTVFSDKKTEPSLFDDKHYADDRVKRIILIIEDDATLLDMYAAKFKRNNFEVKIASSGTDALAILRSGYKPDVMLLDLIMPGMDGFSIYEAIKKEDLAPNALAIMLTNQGLTSDINKAKELGFGGYIVKAMITSAELVNKVLEIYHENRGKV